MRPLFSIHVARKGDAFIFTNSRLSLRLITKPMRPSNQGQNISLYSSDSIPRRFKSL